MPPIRSDMPLSAAQAIPWAQECGFELLPLDLPHQLTLEQLPLHHRDPFDRLLVAQSISESLLLVCADPAFHAFGGPLQDARQLRRVPGWIPHPDAEDLPPAGQRFPDPLGE